MGKDVHPSKTDEEAKQTAYPPRFREQIERGERYDKTEWGGCGCFAPVQQERMDAPLLEADIRRLSGALEPVDAAELPAIEPVEEAI